MRFTDGITLDGRAAESLLYVDPAFDWLRDHFPGNPVLPGLVMLEAAVRTASALYAGDPAADTAAALDHLVRLQVVRRVVPGDALRVRAELLDRDASGATFRAEAHVEGALAMRARFRLKPAREWSTTV